MLEDLAATSRFSPACAAGRMVRYRSVTSKALFMDDETLEGAVDLFDDPYDTHGRKPFHWRTAIAWKSKDRIVCRGYDVQDLAENVSLVDMIFLLFQGRLPSAN